jgi:nicotinate-nucleotide pyrophosphorylase (carboxylating)
MTCEFAFVQWDAQLESELRGLIRLAVLEDLERGFDWTTRSLVSGDAVATAAVVARHPGIAAGLQAGSVLVSEMACRVHWFPEVEDGVSVRRGDVLARLEGNARDLLTLERILLNILGHLGGIATLTSEFVRQVAGTSARVFDTRKTLPGWRRLQKYAVRCGGGYNHRMGLHDAILIKDNHLCQMQQDGQVQPADAVRQARAYLTAEPLCGWPLVLEVEVDSLEMLPSVLDAFPDIVLLDNLSVDDLCAAVQLRNRMAPAVQLEASGGIRLETIGAIAATGIDRISVGALTHSAPNLDIGLDWGSCGF